MKIEVYALAHQEEMIMPYFMRHYTQFADVILMEGHSTDKTVEIAESWGAKIMKIDTGNQINDKIFTDLKNNCWKGSKADWVIVCDVDEFVYHPNLVEYLEKTEATIFLPRLFNMFSNYFPTTEGQIYEEVRTGREGGSKMNLFKPSEIKEINYVTGCHDAGPEGNVKLDLKGEILTLHMRHLSWEYVNNRNIYFRSRLSDINKEKGWGIHLFSTEKELIKYMRNEMTAMWTVV